MKFFDNATEIVWDDMKKTTKRGITKKQVQLMQNKRLNENWRNQND